MRPRSAESRSTGSRRCPPLSRSCRSDVAISRPADEAVQVGGPPPERRPVRRIPVVVVAVVEELVLEDPAAAHWSLAGAHRVLVGIVAVASVERVWRLRLQRSER